MNHKLFRITSIVLSLVGVLLTATFASAHPLRISPVAEPDVNEAIPAVLGQPVTLQIGEWALFEDMPDRFAVQIADLISDSRCPSDVNCAVRGEAIFGVRLSQNWQALDQEFSIGEYTVEDRNKIRYAGYVIELTGVEPPAPKHTEELSEEEYEVTLIVTLEEVEATPVPTPTEVEEPISPEELPTPISSSADELLIEMDQPFELRVGQTAKIDAIDFALTLRSVSDNSGCFREGDCSTITFEGSYALNKGDEKELPSMMVVFSDESPYTYEFAGLWIQLFRIQKTSDGAQVGLFMITQPSAPSQQDGPAPQVIERCPSFSRFDAAAILQEDVQRDAIANLQFYPQPDFPDDLTGLCGYVNTDEAESANEETPTIGLLTAVEGERAVVAAHLRGSEADELLPFAQHLLQMNPQRQESDLMSLAAPMMAGMYDELLPFFLEDGAQIEGAVVESLVDLGDEGIWFWERMPNGNFSLLVARQGDDFAVVAALLSDQVDPSTVRAYATFLVQRMLGDSTIVIAPRPTEEPTVHTPPTGCDLITASEAEAIMGEPVHDQAVDDPSEGCGYVSAQEADPSDDDFDLQEVEVGVLSQRSSGSEMEETLLDIAETVGRDVDDDNETARTVFNAAILSGDIDQALLMLENIADGSSQWRVEELEGVTRSAVMLWGRVDDRRLAVLLTTDESGDLAIVVASLPASRRRSEVRTAMTELAIRLAAGE